MRPILVHIISINYVENHRKKSDKTTPQNTVGVSQLCLIDLFRTNFVLIEIFLTKSLNIWDFFTCLKGPRARSHDRLALNEASVVRAASACRELIEAEYPGGLGRSEEDAELRPPLVKSRLHRPRFLGGCEVIFHVNFLLGYVDNF